MKRFQENFASRTLFISRVVAGVLLVALTIASAGVVFVLKTKQLAFSEHTARSELVSPFPIGVDPVAQTITEQAGVTTYLNTHFASEKRSGNKTSWLHKLNARLATHSWYQNLATPESRILVIYAGERKEQVVDNFGDILRWDTHERNVFETLITEEKPYLSEGIFFPGRYVTHKDADPVTVAALVRERFTTEILERYTPEVATTLPLADALIIASLLEREAYEFDQMREIAGVIWNRLFVDMKLQLDASLQYIKAESIYQPWWPQVHPQDKFSQSPYNTYQNKGLPPTAIANPSAAAVLAALNPKETDCLFYFHDREGTLHCTNTYEAHVAKLTEIFGHGQ